MTSYRDGRQGLALAFTGALLGGAVLTTPTAEAEGFVDDSTLTGGLYYWYRDRERKDVSTGQYETNLNHSTANANLDFSSGYAGGVLGMDLAAFTAVEITENKNSAHPNEIAFSSKNKTYDEDYSGDKSDVSLYKAAAKLKYGAFWARGGYIQPSGQTLLAPHWSFLPGTYRGAEAGANFDYDKAGALSFSYMWADQYKAPWHTELDDFYRNDRTAKVAYVHSLGAKYDFKNDLVLEAAVGQSEGYVDQYFAKASYKLDVGGHPLTTSYQYYGAHDKVDNGGVNDLYDGTAWLQALTLGYKVGAFDFRLEGTMVKADGNQGYFLQRMTPTYASSNGRLDIWWDNRSDFNANGEKAVFGSVMYDLAGWQLPGFAVGTSYVYGWDAKPSSAPQYDQSQRVIESAYSLDAMYVIQSGVAKGTLFKLHFTRYDNHSDNPSWSNGYGNMFQDEHDVKFIVIAPFSLL